MRDAIRVLTSHSRLPISCIPNAGLPIEVEGETVYPMEPEPFARILGEYVGQYGVAVVGGCCGTRPDAYPDLARSDRLRPRTGAARDRARP